MIESLGAKFEALLREDQPPLANSRSVFWSRPGGGLHVQWYRAHQRVSFDAHTHPEFNILVSLEGAVETRQLGMAETAEPGEAMMGSNPGVEHASAYLTGPGGCEAVNLTFSPDSLGDRFGHRAPVPSGFQQAYVGKVQSPVIQRAAREIVDELKAQAPGYEIVLEGLASRILVESLRIWPRNRIERVADDGRPRLSRRDHVRAFEFMRWCRKDQFRLQHLCRFLGTSEERFTRLFRAATGDSPASFYNRLLLDQACQLLAGEGTAVKEVSYRLGFKTPSHFVVAFRRQFGCTPVEYRQSGLSQSRPNELEIDANRVLSPMEAAGPGRLK